MDADTPIVTYTLIALTVVVSWIGFSNPRLIDRLIFWPPAVVRQHQVDRLLTHGFIHADFAHLLFNMITLFFFGGVMERFFEERIGRVGYALFYLGSIAAAILPSLIRHRDDAGYRSLGASGGVAAVLFGFILLAPWTTLYVFVIPVPAIVFAVIYTGYSIWMDRRGGDRVNHGAHLAGAAFGLVMTVLIEPRTLQNFRLRLLEPFTG